MHVPFSSSKLQKHSHPAGSYSQPAHGWRKCSVAHHRVCCGKRRCHIQSTLMNSHLNQHCVYFTSFSEPSPKAVDMSVFSMDFFFFKSRIYHKEWGCLQSTSVSHRQAATKSKQLFPGSEITSLVDKGCRISNIIQSIEHCDIVLFTLVPFAKKLFLLKEGELYTLKTTSPTNKQQTNKQIILHLSLLYFITTFTTSFYII